MDDNCYHINDDYLDDDDDGIMYTTKDYCSDSDEDDLTAFLSKTIKKKKKFNEFDDDDDDDSDDEDNKMDDFEKEMAAELKATMEKIMAPYISKPSTSGKEKADGESTHYDKIYFDSDDDDVSQPLDEKKEKHKIISNDDLFYDPLMDDEDQAWVDSNRRKYQLRSKKLKSKDGKIKPQALPHSDAVLNCPACFSTLCHDCQRHEIYKNQYRAMFVFNCVVDKSERLHFDIKEDKKKKFKKGKKNKKKSMEEDLSKMEGCEEASSTQDGNPNSEAKDGKDAIFHPVKCALCNTKIAVQDEDEVYHFFNVLTSY